MNILEKWYEELMGNSMGSYNSKGSECLFYKGFKLTKTLDGYKLEDIRLSDFYDPVKKKDYDVLMELGFIKGADTIVNNRNIKRVRIYTRIIERLYEDKKEYKSNLRPLKTRVFFQKKLRNCQENINKNIDLMFLHKSQINQYNSKYNTNEKIEN
jgi:hypothetical protein